LGDDKIWKLIVNHKYELANENILACSTPGASPFWKGVMWAAKVARMDIGGTLEMGKRSISGKTSGLVIVV
jgi:hypothetical protein